MSCFASGDASIGLTWQKVDSSGAVLQTISTPLAGALDINPVAYNDQGRYLCTASNPSIVDPTRRVSQAYLNVTVWGEIELSICLASPCVNCIMKWPVLSCFYFLHQAPSTAEPRICSPLFHADSHVSEQYFEVHVLY